MSFLLKMIISAVAILITAGILPGVQIKGFFSAFILAIVLALLNALVYPLMVVLTIPVTIITFGLFLFVLNALVVMLAAGMVGGVRVDGFWWALAFSLVMSVVMYLLEMVFFAGSAGGTQIAMGI